MLDEINRLNTNIFMNYTKLYEMEMIQKKTEIAFCVARLILTFCIIPFLSYAYGCRKSDAGSYRYYTIPVPNFPYSICGDDIVTLEQELEVVKSYLLIQTSRFEDRFTVEFDCAKETLSALIPKMIIQPLVENAIVHGLEKSLKKQAPDWQPYQ